MNKPGISVAFVQNIYHIRFFFLAEREISFEVSSLGGSLL